MNNEDLLDGLHVIARRRGQKIQQGDVEFIEAAIKALAKPASRPEADTILQAQEHAIACGSLALELQSALAILTATCTEAGWPRTAEQMAPMNMARVALKKKLSTPQDESR